MLSKDEYINLISSNVEEFNAAVKENDDGIDMSELDFSGINVEGAEFINVDLTSSSFADSHLTAVKFDNCDLSSTDFTRANLVECTFTDSVLNGTDFSYSTVDYCNFSDSDMAGAVMQGADLSNSDLSMSENLSACRFDEETVWPDNEYLPEDFDSTYSSDLSSLTDEDDADTSDY